LRRYLTTRRAARIDAFEDASYGRFEVHRIPRLPPSASVADARPAADLVLLGRFVTLASDRPDVEASAVQGGRMVAVGTRSEVSSWIGPQTKETRLPGIGLPGFAEAHGHPEGVGRPMGVIDLHGLSKPKILARVAEAVRGAAPGAWIQGDGW